MALTEPGLKTNRGRTQTEAEKAPQGLMGSRADRAPAGAFSGGDFRPPAETNLRLRGWHGDAAR